MFWYIATPYSKHSAGIVAAFEDAARLTARLINAGHAVFSPIAHSHPVAILGGIDPLDHKIWLAIDEHMMRAADALLVADMDGWRESDGVAHEIAFFVSSGKPVLYLDCETLEISEREPTT